jgi:adenine-specific DNA-methyltransferase
LSIRIACRTAVWPADTLKPRFFDESDRKKKAKIKRQIDDLIHKLTNGREDFDFEIYFSEVFHSTQGFDIVMANPPYIRIQNIDPNEVVKLKRQYRSATGKFDIYVLFVEAAFKIINTSGTIIFIHPHRFLTAEYGKGFKAFLDEVRGLRSAILFGVEQIFETGTTYTGIFTYCVGNDSFGFKHANSRDFASLPFVKRSYAASGNHWIVPTEQAGSEDLVVKLKSQARPLRTIFQGIYQGIVTVGDDIFVLRGKRKGLKFVGYSAAAECEVEIEAALVKPLVKGEHIRRYGVLKSGLGIIYPHHLDALGKTVPYSEREMKDQFPHAYAYFKPFKKRLIEKKIKYKTNPEFWFSLHRAREMQLFDGPKIITPQLQNVPHFTLDEDGWYPDAGGYSLVARHSSTEDKHFLLGVLNSKILWYFIKNTSNPYNNSYYYFKTTYLEPFSLPPCSSEDQNAISVTVRRVMDLRKTEGEASEAVRKIEADIDRLVFKLYGLSAAEIETVEKASPIKQRAKL